MRHCGRPLAVLRIGNFRSVRHCCSDTSSMSDQACSAAEVLLCMSAVRSSSSCVTDTIAAAAAAVSQVWDLLDRSHEPSLTISASSCAITSLAFSNATPKHHTHGALAADANSNNGPIISSSSTGTGSAATGAGGAGGSGSTGANTPQQGSHHSGGQQQQGSGLQVLAVGDAAGVLHLFELPRTLRRPLANERRLMEAWVAREAARVADVAGRQVRVA